LCKVEFQGGCPAIGYVDCGGSFTGTCAINNIECAKFAYDLVKAVAGAALKISLLVITGGASSGAF
jgi:hypothetical protein